ncbi:hypothetical protein D915_007800 [Fasciola hepatica]|uniref:Uncharacterized protein n=1 Tax=Fasciola hepatica TaxID=6192 RepID=A0A4E0RIJ0_FASHE|nr:hypothetical protein D915_007800 [Fasciola hepatica]
MQRFPPYEVELETMSFGGGTLRILAEKGNCSANPILGFTHFDCEAPLVTEPNILLCDLTLHRTNRSETQYELSIPKEYSALFMYVWKSSHHSQAVVSVTFQRSITLSYLAYQSAMSFEPIGETLTVRLIEHVNQCRLIIVGSERVEDLPTVMSHARETQRILNERNEGRSTKSPNGLCLFPL